MRWTQREKEYKLEEMGTDPCMCLSATDPENLPLCLLLSVSTVAFTVHCWSLSDMYGRGHESTQRHEGRLQENWGSDRERCGGQRQKCHSSDCRFLALTRKIGRNDCLNSGVKLAPKTDVRTGKAPFDFSHRGGITKSPAFCERWAWVVFKTLIKWVIY